MPKTTTAAAKPAQREKTAPVQVAAALPPKTASTPFSGASVPWPDQPAPLPAPSEGVMAYAPMPGPELNSRPASPPRSVESRPLPATTVALPAPVAAPAFIPRETSIVVRQDDGKPAIVHTRRFQTGEAFDDPWLRAAILAPSLARFMTASVMGGQDYRGLSAFMQKPTSLVTMAFSDDPNPGLLANHFSGQAVVFVATTTFSERTAMLQ